MTETVSNDRLGRIEKLVVGLGNPGEEYTRTRHNLGFRALDSFLRAEEEAKAFTSLRKARVQEVRVEGAPVLLVRPSTFMNLSGNAVAPLLESTNLGLEDLLVIHDEMDLPAGRAKMRIGGGAAGHKGVADIIARCGDGFARIKIGIGSPPGEGGEGGIEWVLGEIQGEEELAYDALMPSVAEAIRLWVVEGAEKAITWFNTRQRESAQEAEVGEIEEEETCG